ncbi:MAG: RecQ family ATP-dependent DNA helicase [Lachnospiraceae bacterium]|nr:RecQ family ATP-dependent DNA helicase [Lachnospiraceae bacterium]
MDKYSVLKETFGYTTFREGQEELVDAIVSGRDVLGIMPTGAGKSLCFQIPALLLPGITIVVSPLISLMKDQVASLNAAGVHAAFINSSLTENQCRKALEFAREGRYKIIYVAPERLMTEAFLALAGAVEISMVAVDEAHCISQWGQDFRPSYLKIVDFVGALPTRPVLSAFTATATRAVKEDIQCILGLEQPLVTVTGYDRKNLYFSVEKPKDKKQELLKYLMGNKGKSGIIYCNTRKTVEELHGELVESGYPATRYHAGLSDLERKQNQEDFIYDRSPIMVATNAFGMGIDKSNVRYVLHYNMPKDVESYYQEAGRAGRDGEPAECILYYAAKDVKINEFLIQQQENPELEREELELLRERNYERLRKMTFYCFTNECLRDYILRYFGEYGGNYCGNCKNCLTEFQDVDVTEEAAVLLELVRSSRERYGIQAITDAVHGTVNDKVRRFGLERNPGFGKLKERTVVRIRQILNDLLVKDYLSLTPGDYPVLKLTDQGRRFLALPREQDEASLAMAGRSAVEQKGISMTERNLAEHNEMAMTGRILAEQTGNDADGSRIVLKLPKEREKEPKKDQPEKRKEAAEVKYPQLFELLRQKRYQMAQEAHVPPYIIFSDKTLREMSTYLPQTEKEMLSINGVGTRKYEQYGKEFAGVIWEYMRDNQISK